MDFEEVLIEWATRQLERRAKGAEITIEKVEIEHEPGSDRDDSYYEPPMTSILITAWARGENIGGYIQTRVSPDLLSIVREMTAIAREGANEGL